MGIYLNPGTIEFQESINSEIYVDKTRLIERTNAALRTKQKYMCISRPRRFGKSMAADMLAAYYGKDTDSAELFDGLEISHSETFSTHLNKYNVFKINMQEFLSMTQNVDEMLKVLQKRMLKELEYKYPEYVDSDNLVFAMQDIFSYTGQSFIILIDEWDCLFREYKQDEEAQRKYLDFLRVWLKDKAYIALAYMTGILPVKKYGTHSALNMFMEYSMTDPGNMAEYFGFTEREVESLCVEYGMSIEETKAWYNGYGLYSHNKQEDILYSIYNPKSVVEAMLRHRFGNYWNQTEAYEALKVYIQMNMDGLKDAIIEMLAGNSVRINIGTFHNDMTTFATRDDILTLLVHLGYLTYDVEKESVRIPNKEVAQEYINAISTMDWKEVISSINNSKIVKQRGAKMTTILCYGDSNTYGYNPVNGLRYPKDIRWTGVLQKQLGEDYAVIEEGCNGRTTVFEDIAETWKAGLGYLKPCLNTHKPIDFVIMMLGSNDLKRMFHASAKEIADGAEQLVDIIKEFTKEKQGFIPKVILVSPPEIGKDIATSEFARSFDEDAIERSKELPAFYEKIAKKYGCIFFNAAKVIESSKVDSLHLMPEAHKKLAEELYKCIKENE